MNRRNFVQQGVAAAASVAMGSLLAGRAPAQPFRLNYAPHDSMFKSSAGPDFVDQIKFMYDRGFRAVEDNGMLKRPVPEQEKIGKTLRDLEMTMGVFVVDGGDNWKTSLTTGKKEFIDNFVKTCRDCIPVAKRVGAKWMTVVPGHFDRSIPVELQTVHVIEALKQGAGILEPHGLIMVLEPLSDTPDLFLRGADQSYLICKAVNSPSCKILYDIYHMQRNNGDLIPTIGRCWDEIAYFQIGDNPDRNEPGTGEINYRNIFKYLLGRGYAGVLGMEHGNSGKDKAGEEAVIEAYRACDRF